MEVLGARSGAAAGDGVDEILHGRIRVPLANTNVRMSNCLSFSRSAGIALCQDRDIDLN